MQRIDFEMTRRQLRCELAKALGWSDVNTDDGTGIVAGGSVRSALPLYAYDVGAGLDVAGYLQAEYGVIVRLYGPKSFPSYRENEGWVCEMQYKLPPCASFEAFVTAAAKSERNAGRFVFVQHSDPAAAIAEACLAMLYKLRADQAGSGG